MPATAFDLRSSTQDALYSPVQQLAPSGGVTAGDLVAIGDAVTVAVETKAAGELAVYLYRAARIVVPCATAATGDYALLTKVYFDSGNSQVTQVASGNTLCGVVVSPASVGDTTVMIELNGTLGITS